MTRAARLVIVGWGNRLRGDDGAGAVLADRVERLGLPGVRAVSLHQLVPEVALDLAEADAAILADARGSPSLVRPRWRWLAPGPLADSAAVHDSHCLGPSMLFAWCRALGACAPRLWCVELPARSLDFSESLSPIAEAGVRAATRQIELAARRQVAAPTSREPYTRISVCQGTSIRVNARRTISR